MIIPENLLEYIHYLIPTITLYAELHYKFRLTGSRYYINEPEILTDTPIRIEAEKSIPIFLVIKDSDKYPIILYNIIISIYKSEKLITSKKINYQKKIDLPWWESVNYIEDSSITGNIKIDIKINYNINNSDKNCYIHNYPHSNHECLNTYVSKYNYPKDKNTVYGDLHYHTNLTEDMVEFGASLKSTLIASEMSGLDFYCNTDHSYDLDDMEGSWTERDPELKKWNKSRKDIKTLNQDINYTSYIVPSEELSLHNIKGRNIHALVLNNSKFIPGSGDSAEKPFNFHSDYNTKTIDSVLEKNSLCIAAHPFVPVPFLQWLFVKRGSWNIEDIKNNAISGLQILNGSRDKGFLDGYKIWINLLLKGYKKYIYAGNDAHGNFNIYRQIKIPMINLHEKKEQVFGHFRTGVLINDDKNKNVTNTINSLKKGNCFLTNGPFLNIEIIDKKKVFNMGSTLKANNCSMKISVISNPEFGKIQIIKVIRGAINSNSEENYCVIENLSKYKFSKKIDIENHSDCYYRCEVVLVDENIFAMTNPIWINS